MYASTRKKHCKRDLRESLATLLLVACGIPAALSGGQARKASEGLPDAPGRDTVQRICGACHPANIVMGQGRTREQWTEVVGSMVSRGAKGSPAQLAEIIDYLSVNLPPKGASGTGGKARPKGGFAGFTMGPNDKQVVDDTAAERGQGIYNQQCASCHGPLARGTKSGPDLVRSLVVLHDRYGSVLGPELTDKHPKVSPMGSLSKEQITDLSHFLKQKVYETLRGGPYSAPPNVLTGDAKAGEAYFRGEGGCTTCHSVTGDLAHIASRYDPPTLQQRMLFPRAVGFGRTGMAKVVPTTVKVTTKDGNTVSGELVHLDDFLVALHDSEGNYHAFARTPDLQVEKHDPYSAHNELLDKHSDKNIHDLVAYLETLK